MGEYRVKIISVDKINSSVKQFRVEKPEGYSFIPGQATDVSINKEGRDNITRPFTFTSLNEWPFLEFVIKIYPERHGFTEALSHLKPGDELIIRDAWGAITYKGPGIFIAGGAGITPFIAIFRQLKKDKKVGGNRLYYSCHTSHDLILYDEFKEILDKDFLVTLTRENNPKYEVGYFDETFLNTIVSTVSQRYYLCGPDGMVQNLTSVLKILGLDSEALVFEK